MISKDCISLEIALILFFYSTLKSPSFMPFAYFDTLRRPLNFFLRSFVRMVKRLAILCEGKDLPEASLLAYAIRTGLGNCLSLKTSLLRTPQLLTKNIYDFICESVRKRHHTFKYLHSTCC